MILILFQNIPYSDKNREYLEINQARTEHFQRAFQKVRESQDVLMNKEKREAYDNENTNSPLETNVTSYYIGTESPGLFGPPDSIIQMVTENLRIIREMEMRSREKKVSTIKL